MPSGGVCGVLSIMPRICPAAASAPAGIVGQLDATRLAATARVHLGLDHHLAAEALGDGARLGRRLRHVPASAPGTPNSPQDRLGLVLVDLHAEASLRRRELPRRPTSWGRGTR